MLISLRSEENGTSPTRGRRSSSASALRPALRAATSSAPSVGSPCTVHRPSRSCTVALLARSATASARSSSIRQRAVDRPAVVALNRPMRARTRTFERDAPARGDDDADRHFVLGQRAGLVGGNDAGGAERLDGRQVPHDGVASCHALDADREHRGDDRRQPFGHGRDGERDAEDQHVEECRRAAHVLDEDDGHDHDDRNGDTTRPRSLPVRSSSRCSGVGFVERLLQQSGNAAHLGAHPGCGHDRPVPCPYVAAVPLKTMLSRSPSGTSSAIAAVSFVTGRLSPVSAASAVWSAVDSMSRPSAGIVSPSSMRMTSPGTISAARGCSPFAVADDRRVGRRHRAKSGDRRLRSRLLDVAHRRVEQHDGEDRDGLVGQARHRVRSPTDRLKSRWRRAAG